jgi:RNase P subunit RPR2
MGSRNEVDSRVPWKDREARNQYQRAYRLRLGMKPRVPRVRERTTCVTCEAPLRPSSMKYCSSSCQRAAMYRDYIERWLRGEVSGGSVASVSYHVRRYLIETRGEQCSLCGWHERHPITGSVPLEMDHLNGNYADNSAANLRLLCPSCHALTPTFKGLNRGNGRPYAVVRREARSRGADGQIRTDALPLTRRSLYP